MLRMMTSRCKFKLDVKRTQKMRKSSTAENEPAGNYIDVAIDRTKLCNYGYITEDENNNNDNNNKEKRMEEKESDKKEKQEKEAETPLGKYLKDTIEIRGPLPLPHYIREALTNSKFGYYTRSE